MEAYRPSAEIRRWLGFLAGCLLFTLLSRVGTQAGWSLVGLLDELAFLSLVALLVGGVARMPRWLSGPWVFVLFGFWSVTLLANELYHRTFNVWISLDQVVNADEVGAIKDSIASLGGASTLLLFLVLPWLVTLLLAWRPPRLNGRTPGDWRSLYLCSCSPVAPFAARPWFRPRTT